MVNALFDNNAGKHERVGLQSKLHHDATNNGHIIKNSKISKVDFDIITLKPLNTFGKQYCHNLFIK